MEVQIITSKISTSSLVLDLSCEIKQKLNQKSEMKLINQEDSQWHSSSFYQDLAYGDKTTKSLYSSFV